MNSSESNFCSTCGGALSFAAVKQSQQDEVNQRTLAALLQKPAVLELLARELAKAQK